MRIQLAALAALIGMVAFVVGCGSKNEPRAEKADKPADPKVQATSPAQAHGHKEGAHQGTIVEVGRDNYHAEAVFEKGGHVRLYMLGNDEGKVLEVEFQALTAYAKVDGGMESVEFDLHAKPQPGDAKGKTSLFIGVLPEELRGKAVDVTVPSIRINGERFRFGFKSAAEPAHAADDGMPPKVSEDEERQLYLTPGGKYSAADVKANGNMTASQKFKGVMAKHDMKPKPGDKICPITMTKANPKFTWIVGGKTYEFCCPPCVDEFVKTAKDQPGEIKEPADYVKQ